MRYGITLMIALAVLSLALTYFGCSGAAAKTPAEIALERATAEQAKKNREQEVTIEEIVKEGGEVVIETSDGAGAGGVGGAIAGTALAVATGGVAPVVGAIGGGAVGAYSGKGTGTRKVTSVCRFRVMINGTPWGYYGRSSDWNYPHAFEKCVTLRQGDKITVHRYPGREDAYRWQSGSAHGPLN